MTPLPDTESQTYQRGYFDGLRDALREFPVMEPLPEPDASFEMGE